MSNNLVSYSRAGDVFHYRWAARRCLRLIYPNSSLTKIYIEGSSEAEKAGEYNIDVSEYSICNDGKKKIEYFQLKHTTVQEDEPFTISDLKDTFTGFAERYLQHKKENSPEISSISFTVISNRKISDSFKANLSAIVKKGEVENVFQKAIEKYTNLISEDLISFCGILHLEDGAGNYNIQKDELRTELAQLIAGSIENAQIENLIALVQEKVLPNSDGSINREDVLKRFGVTSERELYPAPAKWEDLENVIERKQYAYLKNSIASSLQPVIVHAAGGVGKSVFCRHLINSLPEGSLAIAYDCFGAGSYRNRSESRHKHRDCLVQIANELATKGLCDPLIVQNTTLDEDIMRKFLLRLEASIKSLKKVTDNSQLFIFIDAADNAEMAAKEYGQSCFAHELLREKMPDACKLVLLCRTERIYLLQPQSFINKLELETFSAEETQQNIRKWFPEASERDGVEFHRLTWGNPRVQANALDVKYESINELLASLGPSGLSVEKQIELQLNTAVSKIKDLIPPEHHHQINSICLGLASLPPHIPIDVLSKVAKVSIDHVKSFISDIGRSLWLSDTSVQFRDEPTETWFRNTFLATKENYEEYIEALEPLANQLSYVAEVLPLLYLESGEYDKLITIALSDKYLPENNPIDARNIRVYRLQFAFKAALKLANYNDAIKLAMRAGEEVAGNQRQLVLFKSNIELIAALQSKEKVQEIAFKRSLSSTWEGSENIYSASLLSTIGDYHGEARGYLRSAMNWLHIHFEQSKKNEDRYPNYDIQDNDILELACAYLNIHGVKGSIDFLYSLKPKEVIFRVVQDLTRMLIDTGKFEEINEFLTAFIREPYYLVAVTSELFQVGRFPKACEIEICLDLLCAQKSRIEKPNDTLYDRIIPAIISFLEVCVYCNLPPQKILRVLRYYVPVKASRMVSSSHSSHERTNYLKAVAIRAVLSGESNVDIEFISPKEFASKKNYESDRDLREFKEVINGLFPWYLLRIQVLFNKSIKLLDVVNPISTSSKEARSNRYRNYDMLPSEIASVCAAILVFYQKGNKEEISEFYQLFLESDKNFKLHDKLDTLRTVCRSSHLISIREGLEHTTYKLIKTNNNNGPDESANQYIALARAVLVTSKDDASVYFDEAIRAISKFGDEMVQRWEAIVSLAQRSCEKQKVSDDLAYRFIRCAELVGENVSREKYWDRGEAVRVCTRMSPCIALSAVSRWRDRDIGWFEYQLENLLIELVGSKIITASEGWALTSFFSNHQLNRFLAICLENEPSHSIQQSLVNDAVHLLQMEGTSDNYWDELKEIADKNSISNETLNFIADYHKKRKKPEALSNSNMPENKRQDESSEKWNDIFEELSITTPEGFSTLIERLKVNKEKGDLRWHIRELFTVAIAKLEEGLVWKFIDAIFLSEDVNHYTIQDILSLQAQVWKNRVSYQAKLPGIVHRFGIRFAHELTNEYSFNSFIKELNLDKKLTTECVKGILVGLANGDELADANMFFGFVRLASLYISDQEATDLVDYSLLRFELHIENDFGDGIWNESLHVTNDISKNVAGFIWSALGSPRSAIRWNAAHCVRKLAEFSCTSIIDALACWMKYDKVDAFGHHNFPFYNLHARQYLMIAFARISIDNPTILNKHNDLFSHYALSQHHILIQKFAVDIILNIENSFPGTYTEVVLTSAKNVGKSNMPVQIEDYEYSTDSYWHKEKEIETNIDFHFAYDFDRDWFEPLGDVFGVSSEQIQDLAASIVVKEWGLGEKNGYNNDPRIILWNRSSHERETWHSHSNYPRTDNLDFYLSYHSMLIVAARLIEKMPVVKTREWWDEKPFSYWLSRHLLTRPDGKWLSDCRDPLPLNRPKWVSEERKNTWQSEITEQDFLNCLQTEGEVWINIKGGWHETRDERTETFSISTALVSQTTSDALLRALITCSDPFDYKLPNYREDRMEIDSGTFQLKGLINEQSNSKGLDEFDPYADEISYPPFSLATEIANQTGLTVGPDGKSWVSDTSEVVLSCETWSSYRKERDEERAQSGMRLKAKLSFLRYLCSSLGYDLILDVGIKRDIIYRYDRDKTEYPKPKHKLFILSQDGKFRSTNTNS